MAKKDYRMETLDCNLVKLENTLDSLVNTRDLLESMMVMLGCNLERSENSWEKLGYSLD